MCRKPNLLPLRFVQFAALVNFHVAMMAQACNQVVIGFYALSLAALPVRVCRHYRAIVNAAMLTWNFTGVAQ